MERIGFGPRFGAALIDFVIVAIGMTILGTIFGVGMMSFAAAGAEAGFSIGKIILMLLPVGYSLTDVFMAATPGKKVLGLIIRNRICNPNCVWDFG